MTTAYPAAASVKQKSVYLHFAQSDGCRYHRLLAPARFLRGDFPGVRFVNSSREDETHGCDAFVLHGLIHQDNLVRAADWQSQGKVFVWSIDDDYLTVPDWNPCKPPRDNVARWHAAARLADHVVVSTDPIKRSLVERGVEHDHVHVAPNLMEMDYYPTATPAPVGNEPVRVLWAGSHTHHRDVLPVVKAVRHVLKKFAGKIEVIFFGQPPPGELATDLLYRGVTWQPGVDLGLYWSTITTMRPHVVLAPLDPCPFNESKSNIRVLDGWALSAAVIASPVGEYKLIVHGEDGYLASTEDAWVDYLELLVTDHELRERLARAGRRRVERAHNWTLPACRGEWVAAYRKILA